MAKVRSIDVDSVIKKIKLLLAETPINLKNIIALLNSTFDKTTINTCKNEQGYPLLHYFCILKAVHVNATSEAGIVNDAIMVNILLNKLNYSADIDVNAVIKTINSDKEPQDSSPLVLGAHSEKIADLLIRRGATINKLIVRLGLSTKNSIIIKKFAEEKIIDINQHDAMGYSFLFNACLDGDIRIVKLLVENGKANIDIQNKGNANNKDNSRPIFAACFKQRDDIIEYLINSGADITTPNNKETTPLVYACLHAPNPSAVKLLLDHLTPERINEKDHMGNAALHLACMMGKEEAVKLFMDKVDTHQVNIHIETNEKQTPLHLACSKGHVAIVKSLLAHGAKTNQPDAKGSSPLTIAVGTAYPKIAYPDILNLLIDRDITAALFMACEKGYSNLVETILEKIEDLNKINAGGQTPFSIILQALNDVNKIHLHDNYNLILKKLLDKVDKNEALLLACQGRHTDVFNMLIQNGAELQRVFLLACENGQLESVKQLTEIAGSRLNLNKVHNNMTFLYAACANGHADVVEYLLSKGADATISLKGDMTPLHIASQDGHDKIVELLLAHGALPETKDGQGKMALHVTQNATTALLLIQGKETLYLTEALYTACKIGRTDLVELLIENNAILHGTMNGRSLLYIACEHGHLAIVNLLIPLLKAKNDINRRTTIDEGQTPLHIACEKGHMDLVKRLIEGGADVKQHTTKRGITPLYLACKNGHLDIVKLLVANGADVNTPNTQDKDTPFSIAQAYPEIVTYLLTQGATPIERPSKSTKNQVQEASLSQSFGVFGSIGKQEEEGPKVHREKNKNNLTKRMQRSSNKHRVLLNKKTNVNGQRAACLPT